MKSHGMLIDGLPSCYPFSHDFSSSYIAIKFIQQNVARRKENTQIKAVKFDRAEKKN